MTISKEAQYALLAEGAYWDIRASNSDNLVDPNLENSNWAPTPVGWTVLAEFDRTGSGGAFDADVSAVVNHEGFSARVYKNTSGEIVIAYAGTQFGGEGDINQQREDWDANFNTALGIESEQVYLAAKLYLEVKKANPTEQISFTGHSLGGGLASLMAAWFDREAYVFAAAPFEAAAIYFGDGKSQPAEFTNIFLNDIDVLVETIAGWAMIASLGRGTKTEIARAAIDAVDQAKAASADYISTYKYVLNALRTRTHLDTTQLAAYNLTKYEEHLDNVHSYAVKGEILSVIFKYANVIGIDWIESDNSRVWLLDSDVDLDSVSKHSQSLHTAALLVPTFNSAAVANPNILKLINSGNLYGYPQLKTGNQDFLTKLIRNEVGGNDYLTGDSTPISLAAPNGMLTHFSNDLAKVSPYASVLTDKAYQQIVAQTIEWYYWQDEDYARSEFIKINGQVIQYTTALTQGIIEGLSKTGTTDSDFLNAIYFDAYIKYLPTNGTYNDINSTYGQWNIGVATGAHASALDANETQVFVSLGDSSSFVGGHKNDVLFGGDGADTLSGGKGVDNLYGGLGADVYLFNTGDGIDAIQEVKGNDSVIKINGQVLSQLTLKAGSTNSYENKALGITATKSINQNDLGIFLTNDPDSLLVLKSFNEESNNYGITLGDPAHYNEVFVWGNSYFDRQVSLWGSGDKDVVNGGGKNDYMFGAGGDDRIDLAAGNDRGLGGAGSDLIYGKVGNDVIVGGLITLLTTSATAIAEDNDVLVGGDGFDLMTGGIGNDVLIAGNSETDDSQPINTDIKEGSHDGTNHKQGEWLLGYQGTDALYGSGGSDMLNGGAGADVIEGNSGDDIILGDANYEFFNMASPGFVVAQPVFIYTPGGIPIYVNKQYPNSPTSPGYYDINYVVNVTANESTRYFEEWETGAYLLPYPKNTFLFTIDTHGPDFIFTPADLARPHPASGYVRVMQDGGSDVLRGGAGNDWMAGQTGDDYVYGGDGNDIIYGEDLVDSGYFTSGDDYLTGDAGNDSIYGGIGDDVMLGGDGDDYLDGGAGKGVMRGGNGNDTLYGGTSDDTILGDAGHDYINGDSGDDVLVGGDGNDSLIMGAGGDIVNAGAGHDLVQAGDGNNIISGEEGDDTINAGGGDDRISGGAGKDILDGGAGIDVYTFREGDGQDVIIDSGDNNILNLPDIDLDSLSYIDGVLSLPNGTDQITLDLLWFSSVQTATSNMSGEELARQFELLTVVESDDDIELEQNQFDARLTGSEDTTIKGNSRNNHLIGNDGNNVIDGDAGADNMQGGKGNDSYYVDELADSITEQAGEGDDTARAYVNGYVLPSNVERLELLGITKQGTGNAANNRITGNFAANVLDGGAGDDVLAGGAGNDTYHVDTQNDQIIESLDEGIDIVEASNNYQLGENIEYLRLVQSAKIGMGNTLDNLLYGNDGDNQLDGGVGNDTLAGGTGNDVYYLDSPLEQVIELSNEGDDRLIVTFGVDTLANNIEILELTGTNALYAHGNALDNTLFGNGADNNLFGQAGMDTLYGLAGNDTLVGGIGTDVLAGDVGDDVYVIATIDDASDRIIELDNEGHDQVMAYVDFTLSEGYIEQLVLMGSLAFNGAGNSFNNIIIGNSAANILDGSIGSDTLIGGVGDDIYITQDTEDLVVEVTDEGIDTIKSSIDYSLPNNIETLELLAHAIRGTGNDTANTILGNDDTNILDGGLGVDLLVGGLGNDQYIINDNDTIVEMEDGGNDTVIAAIVYTLPSYIENLLLIDSVISGTGNELDNTIVGNDQNNKLDGVSGDDTLIGGLGDDRYIVDSSADVIVELSDEGLDWVMAASSYTLSNYVENIQLMGTENSTAEGNDQDNVLLGNAANNRLIGHGGMNTLIGGDGNDTYVIDSNDNILVEVESYYDSDTEVYHDAGDYDRIESSVSLDLNTYTNIEEVKLIGGAALWVRGNALPNMLIGNDAANILYSEPSFNIHGSILSDTLVGGGGNDLYYISYADTIIEASQAGNDTIMYADAGHFVLPKNIENFVSMNTVGITVTGNALNNNMTGNSGPDHLAGSGGIDTLVGGSGNDLYVVTDTDDIVIELADGGLDQIQSTISYILPSNIEQLFLLGDQGNNGFGNGDNNRLVGNSGQNKLSGAQGDDVLNGSAGNDALSGGEGHDTFVFDSPLTHLETVPYLTYLTQVVRVENIDSILDFSVQNDVIWLDRQIFSPLTVGTLSNTQFVARANAAAQDTDDHILYDTNTGGLYFDADGSGSGAAIKFAQLNLIHLESSNLIIY